MESPKPTKVNVRLLAVKALSDINRNGAFANLTLQNYITSYHLDDLDRRFFTEIVYGCIRRKNYLDTIIEYLSKRKIKKLSSMVVEILRTGIYQIIYMDKVPDSAAVNESVKLSKKLTRGLSGFVNAILHNVIRQAEELAIDNLANDELEKISLLYNQPLWLVKLWVDEFGPEDTEDLCSWFNQTPRLTARVNLLKTNRESCIRALEKLGWDIVKSDKLPEAIYIDHHQGALEGNENFNNGEFTFMDEASMTVAHVVDPKVGETILDCCAAPGGKTMHLATFMNNKGKLMAGDIHEHKISLLEEAAKRLGVDILEAKLQDASTLPDNYIEKFDRVLVDAPCSGLGILEKKLDLRWRKVKEEIDKLPALQLKILNSAAKTVKVGGTLVYSTCTINRKENEEVIKKFLQNHHTG